MVGRKVYLQPLDMLVNAIHDLKGLQKGKTTICDTARGLVGFHVTMYESEWEYVFSVTDIGKNRCSDAIRIIGDAPVKERFIDHEFALLDYALIDRAKIEYTEQEVHENQILDDLARKR